MVEKMNSFKILILATIILSFNAKSYTLFTSYSSCSTWNQVKDKDKPMIVSGIELSYPSQLIPWLAGFTNALNIISGEDNFENIDIFSVHEYVANFCEKNPSRDSYVAIFEVMDKIKKNKKEH